MVTVPLVCRASHVACGVAAGADTRSAKGESHAARAEASVGPQHFQHLPTVPHSAFVNRVLLQVLLIVNKFKPWEYYEDSHPPAPIPTLQRNPYPSCQTRNQRINRSWAWWCTSKIPALGRQRLEDHHKFEAS